MNELLMSISLDYKNRIKREMNAILDRVNDLKEQLYIENFEEITEIIKQQKSDYELLGKILNYC